MYKPESVLENDMYKIRKDFEIQIYLQILARILHQVLINKKIRTCYQLVFCHSRGPQSRNENEQKDRQILEPCQRTNKAV